MARLSSTIHPSLNDDVLNSLFSKKIFTVIDFVEYDLKQLESLTYLPFKELIEIRSWIIKKYSAEDKTGLDCYNELLSNGTIVPTGISSLDEILNGGFLTGGIYEICGPYAAGKTQLCVTTAVNVAEKLNQPIYCIDSKRDFSSRKIQSVLQSRNLSNEKIRAAMELVKIISVRDIYELLNALHGIKEKMPVPKLRLVIIDSLPAVVFQEEFVNNLGHLNNIVNVMRYIANRYHVVFMVVNILISKSEQQEEKPGLGKYWSHVPNTRLLISKRSDNQTTISVAKSTVLKSGISCDVKITDTGVV